MTSKLNSNRMIKTLVATVLLVLGITIYFYEMQKGLSPMDSGAGSAAPAVSEIPAELERSLETDAQGLSKAVAVIQTTRGKIRFKFYTMDAPKTVHRMVSLIRSGFYNGLTFHRVVPGFVIQGGDPTGNGSGGSGITLPAEFNSRKHVPGTVAMARTMDPNSADSQFYISLGTLPNLDGNYTVFGQLIEGQEVAGQIQKDDRMTAITLESQ
jgi:cyclophilin family peptidyl-prolyl cis-trans isomerase